MKVKGNERKRRKETGIIQGREGKRQRHIGNGEK